MAGYDRQGMLHSLSHALWESDTTVSHGPAPPRPAGLSGPRTALPCAEPGLACRGTLTSFCKIRAARLHCTECPALNPSAYAAAPQVFKAHITTSPNGKVADMFWLYDNRNELPENHRVLEVCDRVKGALGPDTGGHCERWAAAPRGPCIPPRLSALCEQASADAAARGPRQRLTVQAAAGGFIVLS